MEKPKTLEQLRAEKERAETRLAQKVRLRSPCCRKRMRQRRLQRLKGCFSCYLDFECSDALCVAFCCKCIIQNH